MIGKLLCLKYILESVAAAVAAAAAAAAAVVMTGGSCVVTLKTEQNGLVQTLGVFIGYVCLVSNSHLHCTLYWSCWCGSNASRVSKCFLPTVVEEE